MVNISLFQTIIQVFMHPTELWKAINITRKKSIFLFLLTALVTAIPFMVESVYNLRLVGEDIGRIADRIPAFVIEDGKINFENELDQAFIAKTDTVTLIINQDKLSDQYVIEREIDRVPMSLILEDTKLVFGTPQQAYELNYDLFEGLTDKFFRTIMLQFNSWNFFTLLPIFLVSFLAGALEGGLQILLLAMMVNILALLSQMRMPFSQNIKLVMVASFIPVLIFAIMNGFGIYPGAQASIIAVLTLYSYHKGVVKHLKDL